MIWADAGSNIQAAIKRKQGISRAEGQADAAEGKNEQKIDLEQSIGLGNMPKAELQKISDWLLLHGIRAHTASSKNLWQASIEPKIKIFKRIMKTIDNHQPLGLTDFVHMMEYALCKMNNAPLYLYRAKFGSFGDQISPAMLIGRKSAIQKRAVVDLPKMTKLAQMSHFYKKRYEGILALRELVDKTLNHYYVHILRNLKLDRYPEKSDLVKIGALVRLVDKESSSGVPQLAKIVKITSPYNVEIEYYTETGRKVKTTRPVIGLTLVTDQIENSIHEDQTFADVLNSEILDILEDWKNEEKLNQPSKFLPSITNPTAEKSNLPSIILPCIKDPAYNAQNFELQNHQMHEQAVCDGGSSVCEVACLQPPHSSLTQH
ncbi:hypothetical protein, partial [Litorimonas sp.]|uniref:hypothetical protein n=1 Tax=Litorimonas sp. TaxID=1892381 RepID=UPI003A852AA7